MLPEGNLWTRVTDRVEPMLIETFDKRTLRVAKAPGEALDKGILHRLSGLDEAWLRPCGDAELVRLRYSAAGMAGD